MSKKAKLQILGALSGIIGFCIVGVMASWWISLGVFIMLFGNNLERKALKL